MNVILYPLSTEKSIRQMEAENTLVFVVHPKATKQEIRKAVEELYKVKIKSVNTVHDAKRRKKAFIRFKDESPAIDLATQLGLM
jgi:large subunit ribosomal protein L23